MPAKDGSHSLYCAVIVKKVDEKIEYFFGIATSDYMDAVSDFYQLATGRFQSSDRSGNHRGRFLSSALPLEAVIEGIELGGPLFDLLLRIFPNQCSLRGINR